MTEGIPNPEKEKGIAFSEKDFEKEDPYKERVDAFLEDCRNIKTQQGPTSPGSGSEVGGLGVMEMAKAPKSLLDFFAVFEVPEKEMKHFNNIGMLIISGKIEEVEGWEDDVGGMYRKYLKQREDRKNK